jgi:hypothetical protein
MLYDGAMVVYHVICTCLGAEFGLPRRVYFHFHEYDRVAHLLCGSIYNTSTFVFFFETDRVKLNHVHVLNVYIC